MENCSVDAPRERQVALEKLRSLTRGKKNKRQGMNKVVSGVD
jgi:hypothetical protein